MLKIYKLSYEQSDLVPVSDLDIVEFLTQDIKRTSLSWWKLNEGRGRTEPDNFAINYAFRKGDRSPFLRGFEFNNNQFEIISSERKIVPVKYQGFPFYDSDKTHQDLMFEGNLEDFLNEFRSKGYEIPSIK